MANIELSKLRRKQDYYQNEAPDWIRTIWDRKESFDWFLKNNRHKLTKNGAIVRLGRDYFINTSCFAAITQSIIGLDESRG